jgi:hypothetical protein
MGMMIALYAPCTMLVWIAGGGELGRGKAHQTKEESMMITGAMQI